MPWIDPIKRDDPEEVYVITNVGLSYGDYLMLTPMFSALNERYSGVKVIFCTELQEEVNILYKNPDIYSVMSFAHFLNIYKGIDRTTPCSIDGVFQIPSIITDEVFTRVNAYKAFCDDLGITPRSYLPKYFVQEKEHIDAVDVLKQKGVDIDSGFIVLQTEASSPLRNWHPVYTLELARRLSEHRQVVLLGVYYYHLAEEVSDISNVFTIVGEVSVRTACAIIDLAELVVCPDSLFAHVAGALSRPCLALMSSFAGELRYKYMPTVDVLQKPYFCAPCLQHNLACCKTGYEIGLLPDERGNYYSMPCMLAITPDEVYEHVVAMLDAG